MVWIGNYMCYSGKIDVLWWELIGLTHKSFIVIKFIYLSLPWKEILAQVMFGY